MVLFRHLLAGHLETRGWSHRQFAARVESGQGFISQVIRGDRTPPLDRLPVWMEVLALSVEERSAFLEAALLAHAPQEVVDLVVELRAKVAALEMRLAAKRKVRSQDGKAPAGAVSQRCPPTRKPRRAGGPSTENPS